MGLVQRATTFYCITIFYFCQVITHTVLIIYTNIISKKLNENILIFGKNINTNGRSVLYTWMRATTHYGWDRPRKTKRKESRKLSLTWFFLQPSAEVANITKFRAFFKIPTTTAYAFDPVVLPFCFKVVFTASYAFIFIPFFWWYIAVR